MATITKILYQHPQVLDYIDENGVNQVRFKKGKHDEGHRYRVGDTVPIAERC